MNLAELNRNLATFFDTSELQTLCLELDIDYENLNGSNKSDKCRELIAYLQRRGRLDELIEFCKQQRPNITWSDSSLINSSNSDRNRISVIRILFLAADPSDTTRLRLGQEAREIQEKLQLARLRERFELHQRMSIRPADLSQAMLDVQPQIIHFSGHGGATGELYIEDQLGNAQPIQPSALAALFEQFANQVNCVLLNACYSELQAKAIANHINYVIGMSKEIGDEAAIAFAIGFYQGLGAGREIEEAYQLGCIQIGLQGISEHLTPVLIRKR